MKTKVAIEYWDRVKYPSKENIIYPDKQYTELKIKFNKVCEENKIFQMVRNAFYNLGLDIENYDTENWNPLGDNIVKPGDTVLIKPNMVLHKNLIDEGEECLYTNPSVVATIINYVHIALKGNGKIIVADAPVQSCDFDELIEKSGYKFMIDFFKEQGLNIELKDLRGLITHYENGKAIQEIVDKDGIIVDLRENSEHAKIEDKDISKVRITNYNPDELLKHHNENKHEYFIAKEALEADVIINMPKPKAHRKAGVTIGLKNFVGVNIRKEYLPHHRIGDIKHGGDEYKKNSILLRISSKLIDFTNILKSNKKFYIAKLVSAIAKIISGIDKRLFSKEKFREGSWYGNDTIWRTIVDINRIIRYADKSGNMKDIPQRKIFTIADMIVVGEKEGPLLPSSKYVGIIAMGENIVCFDEIIATLMGMNINKIPLFKHIRDKRKYPLIFEGEQGEIISNNNMWNNKMVKDINKEIAINIEPSSGWKGNIELEK